ncbi:hypothetical protein [Mobilicoccus caccae]|uniref:DUF3109 family protein n=1 Tax=Mobilicoccus caccae TaxID=1859295 RepID=A0ABQ6IKK8_9MICO|nr:hypothetical protein [Mobilicoccus caccae]GMA38424.1 hypothetical protein GCM10025883_04690 [Mobilicoccus caccae]
MTTEPGATRPRRADECDEPSTRIWVEFDDPAEEGRRFRCDLTWLTSDYHCVFGAGCPGIDADRPDDGCCTLGAHFTDDEDRVRVEAVVRDLGPQEWELREEALTDGWTEFEDGEEKTRVVDGACILLNGPGAPAGAGCALHHHAVARGLQPHTVKPDVCWQLPLRRTYRDVTLPDETEYQEVSIGEYTRAGWGPGGHDLDWYCTASPRAHTGSAPLFRTSEAELVELMGRPAYDELARRCTAHLASVSALSHVPEGARMLPLLVHPATLAARANERG